MHRNSFVIISDSRSALQVVEHYDSTHPLINKVVYWLHGLHYRRKTVCLCCSNVGVLGNEPADRQADVAVRDASNTEVPCRGWYPIIQSNVKHKWNEQWLAIGTNKLKSQVLDRRVPKSPLFAALAIPPNTMWTGLCRKCSLKIAGRLMIFAGLYSNSVCRKLEGLIA